MDEASMVANPDLVDVIGQVADSGAKLILAGDTQQLQAVENGGGLCMLAGALGFVQLAEPVRFRAGWEQAASLRLRAGDSTVLAEYDQHGRIRGGDSEQMMDAAAADYLALTLDGTDVPLMAADHARRRELSRRIRDDLIRLGIVSAGPAARIADGATASPGDLIVCTRNDHTVQAGEPGRTLANGDLLRIETVTPAGLVVRRALDADPATGQRQWTDRTFLYQHFSEAEPGYAVTDHVAQSRTVHTGLAVITGTEDRQHAYVALSRGTSTNMAYVFMVSPKLADLVPGPRPAPELARYDRIAAGHDGQPAAAAAGSRDALAVLAGVLGRDGQKLSASQTRQQALANADHLAILHAIWTDQTAAACGQRFRDLLLASLPPEYRREPGHQAKWLWRTLRGAERAGLDVGQVLAAASGERDLAGGRDLAAVIDARIRYRTGPVVPALIGSWSDQVPAIADPERRAYLTEIAAMMDARKDRIGEHAAEHAPPWAVTALGPIPADPLDRWTGRNGPPPSAPGESYPATAIPPTRSGPNPSRPPRT
jgi:AAA domain